MSATNFRVRPGEETSEVNLTVAKPAPFAVDLRPQQRHVQKPWGWEMIWAENDHYTGKLLHVIAGRRLSLQYHDQKQETVCLLHGSAVIAMEDETGELREIPMEPGKGYTIHLFQLHRLRAVENADILEVSEPERGNTIRIEDDYGRSDESEPMRSATR
jgi:mannose-6-phosphate isomerase